SREPVLERTILALSETETADEAVLEILKQVSERKDVSVLIFTYRTISAVKLAALVESKFPGDFGPGGALAYHARMSKAVRERTRKSYLSGRSRCVVTTTALAAGVNFPTTDVIIRDLTFPGFGPLPLDQLSQMVGRAGRSHQPGHAFLVHRPSDGWKIDQLINQLSTPAFPALTSAIAGGTTANHSRSNSANTATVATAVLSLLARREEPLRRVEISDFFARSLVGTSFTTVLDDALQWICDTRRLLAYE